MFVVIFGTCGHLCQRNYIHFLSRLKFESVTDLFEVTKNVAYTIDIDKFIAYWKNKSCETPSRCTIMGGRRERSRKSKNRKSKNKAKKRKSTRHRR